MEIYKKAYAKLVGAVDDALTDPGHRRFTAGQSRPGDVVQVTAGS